VDDAEIIDLTAPTESTPAIREPAVPPVTKKVRKPIPPKKTADSSDPVIKAGEDEFWNWAGPK
jgi:hypothetical protein